MRVRVETNKKEAIGVAVIKRKIIALHMII